MTADTKECNGGCEVQKVEFEEKVGSAVVLEKDRNGNEDNSGIGHREGEESGGDESEGSFVMVNEDSDDRAERDLDLGGKAVSVETEESGGPPANVCPSAGEVVAGDRETGGEKGGDHESVGSVLNSEIGVEDRKDAAAVSGAKEEKMESETNTAAVAEERNEKEVNGQGELESNNGMVNNDVEFEGEQKEETVSIDSELHAEPESVDKEKLAPTETDGQIRSEIAVEVEERQEPETVVTKTNHQAELESATDVEDRQVLETVEVEKQDTLTATRGTGRDGVEAESAVAVETQEPQIVSTDKNAQERLEIVVLAEENPETKTAAEAGDQAVPDAIVEVGEKQNAESVVREPTASESHPLEHEEVRLSAEDAMASEGQCENKLQTTESGESSESHEASSICHLDAMVKETESSADLESLKNSSVCHVGEQELVKEVEVNNKSAGNHEASPSETETGIFSANEPRPSGCVSGADLEPELINASATSEVEAENVLDENKESTLVCSNYDTGLENKVSNDVEIEKDVSTNHAIAMKSEPKIENDSAEVGEHLSSAIKGNQATRKDDDKEPTHEEVEAVKEIQSPPEDPTGSTLEGDKVETQVVKWQRCYIIRVPRFTDDELWAQIKNAQLELEEKTRSRDSIGVVVQKKKATCNEYREKLETAKAKERAARTAFNVKRQEIESVQSILNKLKNATSIEEIDNKIAAMDREFQHSTMGLKEEKQHLQNIKHLRQLREQLSSIMGPKSDIDMAFDQRDQTEERFKTLKKELDSLKADLSEAETKGKEVRKEYDHEVQHLRDIQQQFRTADEIRQKAYGHWRDLKNESLEKSKYFHMYKNDQRAAANYIASGDREGLQLHCSKQVENIMELWNNNDEFRMQYVKSNKNSTLRRLRTLDGRSLGPDEEPPALRTNTDKSSSFASNLSNINPPVAIVASEAKPRNLGALAPKEKSFPALQAAQTNHSSKSKKYLKPSSKETMIAAMSDREEVEADPKEKRQTKEEEEQARKAEELTRKEEELRKKKAEAEMKEQLRLEQKAKAKEAEERKRRKAEKAQARAEYHAQKEAELREKKKLKKEKKKASSTSDITNGGVEDNGPATDSSPLENAPERGARALTASKRASRPSIAAKHHDKIQPLPMPLRNRGKRKMRTWMWVLLTTLLVLALFLAGNYISFSFSLPQFDF